MEAKLLCAPHLKQPIVILGERGPLEEHRNPWYLRIELLYPDEVLKGFQVHFPKDIITDIDEWFK